MSLQIVLLPIKIKCLSKNFETRANGNEILWEKF